MYAELRMLVLLVCVADGTVEVGLRAGVLLPDLEETGSVPSVELLPDGMDVHPQNRAPGFGGHLGRTISSSVRRLSGAWCHRGDVSNLP